MPIEIVDLPPEHYLNLIKENSPFSFSRFGDGEVLCMHNTIGLHMNCDGSQFLPEIVKPMKQIFMNQYPYYHCLIQCSFDLEGDWFKRFLNTTCPKMKFYKGDIWQDLSFSGQIEKIVQGFNQHKTCIVGGNHLKNIQELKGIETELGFIETPSVDSFKQYNNIFDSVMKLHNDGYRYFAFSTGYTTKILIDSLFPYIGHNTFLIDFGSVFDPYCGKLSRTGMQHDGYSKFQPYTNYKLE